MIWHCMVNVELFFDVNFSSLAQKGHAVSNFIQSSCFLSNFLCLFCTNFFSFFLLWRSFWGCSFNLRQCCFKLHSYLQFSCQTFCVSFVQVFLPWGCNFNLRQCGFRQNHFTQSKRVFCSIFSWKYERPLLFSFRHQLLPVCCCSVWRRPGDPVRK